MDVVDPPPLLGQEIIDEAQDHRKDENSAMITSSSPSYPVRRHHTVESEEERLRKLVDIQESSSHSSSHSSTCAFCIRQASWKVDEWSGAEERPEHPLLPSSLLLQGETCPVSISSVVPRMPSAPRASTSSPPPRTSVGVRVPFPFPEVPLGRDAGRFVHVLPHPSCSRSQSRSNPDHEQEARLEKEEGEKRILAFTPLLHEKQEEQEERTTRTAALSFRYENDGVAGGQPPLHSNIHENGIARPSRLPRTENEDHLGIEKEEERMEEKGPSARERRERKDAIGEVTHKKGKVHEKGLKEGMKEGFPFLRSTSEFREGELEGNAIKRVPAPVRSAEVFSVASFGKKEVGTHAMAREEEEHHKTPPPFSSSSRSAVSYSSPVRMGRTDGRSHGGISLAPIVYATSPPYTTTLLLDSSGAGGSPEAGTLPALSSPIAASPSGNGEWGSMLVPSPSSSIRLGRSMMVMGGLSYSPTESLPATFHGAGEGGGPGVDLGSGNSSGGGWPLLSSPSSVSPYPPVGWSLAKGGAPEGRHGALPEHPWPSTSPTTGPSPPSSCGASASSFLAGLAAHEEGDTVSEAPYLREGEHHRCASETHILQHILVATAYFLWVPYILAALYMTYCDAFVVVSDGTHFPHPHRDRYPSWYYFFFREGFDLLQFLWKALPILWFSTIVVSLTGWVATLSGPHIPVYLVGMAWTVGLFSFYFWDTDEVHHSKTEAFLTSTAPFSNHTRAGEVVSPSSYYPPPFVSSLASSIPSSALLMCQATPTLLPLFFLASDMCAATSRHGLSSSLAPYAFESNTTTTTTTTTPVPSDTSNPSPPSWSVNSTVNVGANTSSLLKSFFSSSSSSMFRSFSSRSVASESGLSASSSSTSSTVSPSRYALHASQLPTPFLRRRPTVSSFRSTTGSASSFSTTPTSPPPASATRTDREDSLPLSTRTGCASTTLTHTEASPCCRAPNDTIFSFPSCPSSVPAAGEEKHVSLPSSSSSSRGVPPSSSEVDGGEDGQSGCTSTLSWDHPLFSHLLQEGVVRVQDNLPAPSPWMWLAVSLTTGSVSGILCKVWTRLTKKRLVVAHWKQLQHHRHHHHHHHPPHSSRASPSTISIEDGTGASTGFASPPSAAPTMHSSIPERETRDAQAGIKGTEDLQATHPAAEEGGKAGTTGIRTESDSVDRAKAILAGGTTQHPMDSPVHASFPQEKIPWMGETRLPRAAPSFSYDARHTSAGEPFRSAQGENSSALPAGSAASSTVSTTSSMVISSYYYCRTPTSQQALPSHVFPVISPSERGRPPAMAAPPSASMVFPSSTGGPPAREVGSGSFPFSSTLPEKSREGVVVSSQVEEAVRSLPATHDHTEEHPSFEEAPEKKNGEPSHWQGEGKREGDEKERASMKGTSRPHSTAKNGEMWSPNTKPAAATSLEDSLMSPSAVPSPVSGEGAGPLSVPVVRRERIVIRPRIPGTKGFLPGAETLNASGIRPSRALTLHMSLIIPFCTGQWFSLMLRYGWRGFLIQNLVMTVTLGFIGYTTICFQLLRKHLKRSTSELSDYGTIVLRYRTLPDGSVVAEEDHIVVEMVNVKVDYMHFFYRLFSTKMGYVIVAMIAVHLYFTSWMVTMIQTLYTLNALVSGAGILVELLIYEVM